MRIVIDIDDSTKNCEIINNNGVSTYLFTSDYNKSYQYDKRVDNWNQIYKLITMIKEE